MPKPDASTEFETRISAEPFQLRAQSDAGAMPTIIGYGAIFNQRSENLGFGDYEFYEIIEPGAFDDVLDDDVRALVNHEGLPLARTTSDTLQLSVDSKGLRYEFTPADTSDNRGLVESINRGDINQSSFRFRADKRRFEYHEEGDKRIEIVYVEHIERLRDVSIVTFPAYAEASADLKRSLEQFRKDTAPAPQPSLDPAIARQRLHLQTIAG